MRPCSAVNLRPGAYRYVLGDADGKRLRHTRATSHGTGPPGGRMHVFQSAAETCPVYGDRDQVTGYGIAPHRC